MVDFTPTPEALEAVAKAIWLGGAVAHQWPPQRPRDHAEVISKATAAIAAFVEAEGLEVEICTDHNKTAAWVTPIGDAQRVVGKWRKRD